MNRPGALPLENVRNGGHRLGLHRVIEPEGALPQAAARLDPRLPIFQNETLVRVEKLNLDSASFRQLLEANGSDLTQVAKRILDLVRAQGKMQNPVTASGGMLRGEVLQSGPEATQGFQAGDRIATLASLTLTPLHLEKILEVTSHGRVEVEGHAILLPDAPAVRLPADLPEDMSLAVLDVCGAPAWVRKILKPNDKVLVLGAGKSGVLSAFAALEKTPTQLWVSDVSAERLEIALQTGVGAQGFAADASRPAEFWAALQDAGAPAFDLVVNACNVPESEAACILAAKPQGRILFFNMNTQFQRAVLSAEGLGREVEMLMGNGFAQGHAEYALELVRIHPGLKRFFSR